MVKGARAGLRVLVPQLLRGGPQVALRAEVREERAVAVDLLPRDPFR